MPETSILAVFIKQNFCRLFTPEKPCGYSIVAIANDITFQSGSFATPEDTVYSLASEYSRRKKLPRINVSCNSGARIGLCEDVSRVFRAKFKVSCVSPSFFHL
ncbi:unnamed protein product [Haemonchus placei]|uniref:CoA carboxyltransferase N-terminal domain-containing protein n=1 Tax=Haemonchus placei TaxID=6290 RepID=A0A3P7Y3P2_HAEPC|nr:unnamed protein product [Haemonchus placei]